MGDPLDGMDVSEDAKAFGRRLLSSAVPVFALESIVRTFDEHMAAGTPAPVELTRDERETIDAALAFGPVANGKPEVD